MITTTKNPSQTGIFLYFMNGLLKLPHAATILR
jgi:hypothetical protein